MLKYGIIQTCVHVVFGISSLFFSQPYYSKQLALQQADSVAYLTVTIGLQILCLQQHHKRHSVTDECTLFSTSVFCFCECFNNFASQSSAL